MKHTLTIISLLLGGGLALGCAQADAKAAPEPAPRDSVATTGAKAQEEMAEAAQAMQDHAYAQRAEFVVMMKEHLAQIQLELDRLSAKAYRSSGETQADAKNKLAAVREKWIAANQQLEQAESATESTWDDVKDGFNEAYAELKDDFDSTRQWLSDRIEP